MKTLILSAMLLIGASTFTTTTFAQKSSAGTSCFDVFRLHRQSKNTVLTWAVSTPDVVQYEIQVSYDGTYFTQVGYVPAVAGTNSYKDSPYAGTIYYRIRAIKADGTDEMSGTESVRIVAH